MTPRELALVCALAAVCAVGAFAVGRFTGTSEPGSFTVFAPFTLFLLTGSALYLWRPQQAAGLSVVLAAGYALWQSGWVYLATVGAPPGEELLVLSRIGPWLLVPHVVAFITCRPGIALLISIPTLLLSGVAMASAVTAPGPLGPDRGFHLASNLIAAQVMVIAVLGGLARMRIQLQERHASLDTLSTQAGSDALTGLMNRDAFVMAFNRDAQTRRVGDTYHPRAVILVDLDHFKAVNDEHGHLIGDAVLIETARMLSAQAGSDVHLCRWGGEEFAILVPAPTAASVGARAEALRAGFGRTAWPRNLHLTASLGFAIIERGESLDDVLRRADAALYEAKRGGRNRVVQAEARKTRIERASARTARDQRASKDAREEASREAESLRAKPAWFVRTGRARRLRASADRRRADDLLRRRSRTLATLLIGAGALYALMLFINRNYPRLPSETALMWAASAIATLMGIIILCRPRMYQAMAELGVAAFAAYMITIVWIKLDIGNPSADVLQLSIGAIWIGVVLVAGPLVCRPRSALALDIAAPLGLAIVVLAQVDFGDGRLGDHAVSVALSAIICSSMLYLMAIATRRLHGLHREVTKAADELGHAAVHDPLTGLLNRRGFEQRVQRAFDAAHGPGLRSATRRATLTAIDLDRFKTVNDTHGHLTGDAVLRQTADLIRRSLQPRGAGCRWGGEEFLILSPEASIGDTLDQIAHLRALMQAASWPEGVRMTASFGLTMMTNADLQAAVQRADEAMYRAKQAGRDRIEIDPVATLHPDLPSQSAFTDRATS